MPTFGLTRGFLKWRTFRLGSLETSNESLPCLFWIRQEAVDDCKEYLVHMPAFEAIAKRHGLELVSKENFTDFVASEAPANRQVYY